MDKGKVKKIGNEEKKSLKETTLSHKVIECFGEYWTSEDSY